MNSALGRYGSALTAVAALLAAGPTSAAENSTERATLDEVVVTAQKRAERLQDVPLSLSVLNAGTLTDQNLNGLGDYFAQVPGLALSPQTSGRMSLAIRGITTGGTTNPTVSVTIDDVPVGASMGVTYASQLAADLDPGTLERVEVLRGPQGTLYGAASLGGLLRYVTIKPSLEVYSGRVQVDAANVSHGDSAWSVRGAVNLPLAEGRFALAASGFVRHDAGVADNLATGVRNVDSADVRGGRLAALWQLTDAVALRLSALYQDTDGDGSSDIETTLGLAPVGAALGHRRNAGTGPYQRTIQQYDATLTADFGWAELTSITGFGTGRFRDTMDDSGFLGFLTEIVTGRDDLGTTTFLPDETDKFSQEIRLASPAGGRLEWLAGAFYTREDSDVQYNIYATDPLTGSIVEVVLLDAFPSEFEETAVFGAATVRFGERFDVQAGGRWSRNDQAYDETITGPLFDPPYYVAASSADRSVTWQVSPRYRFSPAAMVYGRVATGYRPGGPNPGAGFGFPSEFDADEVTSYEAGFKGEFLDRRLSLDLSVYTIDWSDIQLQQRDPDSGFLYYTNAGKARSRGLEGTLQAVPLAGLTVTATLAYTDAELRQPTSGGIVAAAGDPLPYSADWTASLAIERRFALSATIDAFAGGTLNHVGERAGSFASEPGEPRVSLPSFTTLDLRAGVDWSGWTVTLFARNVTDELGVLGAEPEVPGGASGVYVASITQPRTVGLAIARSF